MPIFRRPQRSIAAGVAASGFLVAAVVGGFLVVGSLVTYGVWPVDPEDDRAPAVVLESARPIVLPPPAPPEPPEPPPVSPGPVAAVASSSAPGPRAPTSVLTPRPPRLGLSRDPSQSGSGLPGRGDAPARDAAPRPGAGRLEPVVDAAESLTAGAARRLRSASVAVEAIAAPLSPDVARAVGDTVDCVADVVEAAGAVVAQGLRGDRDPEPPPADGFPGARPDPQEPVCRLAPHVPGGSDPADREPPPGT